MSKVSGIFSRLGARPVFSAAVALLLLQTVLLGYSYTHPAQEIVSFDGTEKHSAVGVSNARWVVLLNHRSRDSKPDPWRREALMGITRISFSGYVLLAVHMVWTIVPNAIVIGIGLAQRVRQRLIQRRAIRRRTAGLCGTCGYDLRASSGTCPECGAMIDHNRDVAHPASLFA